MAKEEILKIGNETVKLRMPQSLEEKIWFSYIVNCVERCGFCKINLEITVNNNHVTNIQNSVKQSFSVHNATIE